MSTTVKYGGETAHLDDGDRTTLGPFDLRRVGRELMAGLTELPRFAAGAPTSAPTADLLVESGGQIVKPVLPAPGGVLQAGQVLLYSLQPPTLWQDMPADVLAFHHAYIDDGPPLVGAIPPGIAAFDSWGPWPDSNNTSATGSGRLFAARVPAAINGIMHWRFGLAHKLTKLFSNGQRWAARQLLRGCHFEDGGAPVRHLHLGQPYCCHQGYSKSETARGGYSRKYSSPLPPGIPEGGTGDQVCDHLHVAVDQCALYAALTGSYAAAWDAFATIEAILTLYAKGHGDESGRGLGHLFRGMAVSYPVCRALGLPVEHWLTDYLPRMLGWLEERNVHVERGSWPVVDSGKEGDHIGSQRFDHLEPFLSSLGWTKKEAAKGCTTWMGCGILNVGLDSLLRFLPDVPVEVVKRVHAQMEVATSFGVIQGQAVAYDVEARELRAPPICWDDVNPGQMGHMEQQLDELGAPVTVFVREKPDLPCRFSEGGYGKWAEGVGVRFMVPGLMAAALRLNRDEPRALANKIMAVCEAKDDQDNAWNSDSRLRWTCESWLGATRWE